MPKAAVKKLAKAPAAAILLPATLMDSKATEALEMVQKVAEPAFMIADKAVDAALKAYRAASLKAYPKVTPKVKKLLKDVKTAKKILSKAKKPIEAAEKIVEKIHRVKEAAEEAVKLEVKILFLDFGLKYAKKAHAKVEQKLGTRVLPSLAQVLAVNAEAIAALSAVEQAVEAAGKSVKDANQPAKQTQDKEGKKGSSKGSKGSKGSSGAGKKKYASA